MLEIVVFGALDNTQMLEFPGVRPLNCFATASPLQLVFQMGAKAPSSNTDTPLSDNNPSKGFFCNFLHLKMC